MGRRKKIIIKEDLQELKKSIEQQTNADIRDRLKLLYLYKQGETLTSIARLLLKNPSSLNRWLNYYHKFGLREYLNMKTTRGPRSTFPSDLENELKQAWQNRQFRSMLQAHKWVERQNPQVTYPMTKNFIKRHFFLDAN